MAIERDDAGARLRIRAHLAVSLDAGDSVAVAGACLTATAIADGAFDAEIMNQTLSVTTLGELTPGDRVNLEPSLRAGQPLGGHFVQGHVDGVGEVTAIAADGFARRLRIGVPGGLERYLVEHGSVTLAGVSLTVAVLVDDCFEVSLIPETLARTTLGALAEGDGVNLELDLIARYVERLLGSSRS